MLWLELQILVVVEVADLLVAVIFNMVALVVLVLLLLDIRRYRKKHVN